jgi:elongation factor Ts
MKVDSKTVKELREKTGAGILNCKQALAKTGGDFEKSIDLLRAEGLARAATREARAAKEGALRIKVSPDGKKAAMVELNSETDFVSRTADFQGLAECLVEAIFQGGEAAKDHPEIVEKVALVSGKTGEKVAFRRAISWTRDNYIGGYLHHNQRLAVLVELTHPDLEAAREIAMQVAVSNPDFVIESEIPAAVAEREKAIFRQQAADKPEKIREKVVEGKWRSRMAELCLMGQPYIRDPKMSVDDYLKKKNPAIAVKGFIRWRLGE